MKIPTHSTTFLAVVSSLIGLAITGLVAWNFAQQFELDREMRAGERQLEAAVAAEKQRSIELQNRLAYVRSDEYVERWARIKARMALPGEVPIIPVEVEVTPIPAAPVAVTPPVPTPAPSLWERFLALIGIHD